MAFLLEQQTLSMKVDEISDFTKEGDEDNIHKTNFDTLVDEFIAGILEDGAQSVSKNIISHGDKIYCIIGWVDGKALKNFKQEQESRLTIPDLNLEKV